MKNANEVDAISQNMSRIKDSAMKMGSRILCGGIDDFSGLVSKYGLDMAERMGYVHNLKWLAKQA